MYPRSRTARDRIISAAKVQNSQVSYLTFPLLFPAIAINLFLKINNHFG